MAMTFFTAMTSCLVKGASEGKAYFSPWFEGTLHPSGQVCRQGREEAGSWHVHGQEDTERSMLVFSSTSHVLFLIYSGTPAHIQGRSTFLS